VAKAGGLVTAIRKAKPARTKTKPVHAKAKPKRAVKRRRR
jgi:hypothetical protein